ncbi:hypothetical protein MKEN_01024400 [Mycena kentingensis (nom. inval.)]|nr:hypothetical protein MKEN_01024400 [Mycena kentingensis (nom. inval.)]
MARGTLRVLFECIRFCNGGRQRSRTTWYAHAPYRIGGRYAHLPYEPSATLKAFLTFGNDSDSDDTADGYGDGNPRPLERARLNCPEVDIDNQPGNGIDNEFYGGGNRLYGGGGGGIGSDEEQEPGANEDIRQVVDEREGDGSATSREEEEQRVGPKADPAHPPSLSPASPAPLHPIFRPPNALDRWCHSPQAASEAARLSPKTALNTSYRYTTGQSMANEQRDHWKHRHASLLSLLWQPHSTSLTNLLPLHSRHPRALKGSVQPRPHAHIFIDRFVVGLRLDSRRLCRGRPLLLTPLGGTRLYRGGLGTCNSDPPATVPAAVSVGGDGLGFDSDAGGGEP